MKLQKLKSGMLLLILAAALTASSCKGKTNEGSSTNSPANTDTTSTKNMDTSTGVTNSAAAVSDDALRTQLKDATKDYPDVTATVDNGEVTLTGTISREKL